MKKLIRTLLNQTATNEELLAETNAFERNGRNDW